MKSIIRLLLISLSIACAQGLSVLEASNTIHHDKTALVALSGLSLQQVQEIVSYVRNARKLGSTDTQIIRSFEEAAQKLDENNGVLILYQKYDKRIVWSVIGVVSVATLAASIWVVYYYLKNSSASSANPENPPANPENPPVDPENPPANPENPGDLGNPDDTIVAPADLIIAENPAPDLEPLALDQAEITTGLEEPLVPPAEISPAAPSRSSVSHSGELRSPSRVQPGRRTKQRRIDYKEFGTTGKIVSK